MKRLLWVTLFAWATTGSGLLSAAAAPSTVIVECNGGTSDGTEKFCSIYIESCYTKAEDSCRKDGGLPRYVFPGLED